MERVYKANSDGAPLDYPSLDVPYYTSLKHSPEAEKAEALRIEGTGPDSSPRPSTSRGSRSLRVPTR